MAEPTIRWTDYMQYRLKLRGFEPATVEHILRHSAERYLDTATGRLVTVGRHDHRLVMIPYEREGETIVPVTIHITSRRQINFRLKSGRFTHE